MREPSPWGGRSTAKGREGTCKHSLRQFPSAMLVTDAERFYQLLTHAAVRLNLIDRQTKTPVTGWQASGGFQKVS